MCFPERSNLVMHWGTRSQPVHRPIDYLIILRSKPNIKDYRIRKLNY